MTPLPPDFWKHVWDWVPITQNLIANVIWLATVPISIAYGRWLSARAVNIHVERIEGTRLARTKPKAMIASFSGYQNTVVPHLSAAEFKAALAAADLTKLPLDETTQSIGPIIRILQTYESLRDLYLVTTRATDGFSSKDSVPLIERYIREKVKHPVAVHEDDASCVQLDDDPNVARQSYLITRKLLRSLRKLRKGEVLVDVTGGFKSMTIGLLLACIDPDQDAHLVGTKYLPSGKPDHVHSVPLLVEFDAHIRGR
jgi:hypothetical protein